MRVFVLTTGRTGSMSFAAACGHATNFSAAHESLISEFGEGRFAYPDDHVEVDCRLPWFLGQLAERFPDARYAHLTRDPDAVARSYLGHWYPMLGARNLISAVRPGGFLMPAFANGIVMRGGKTWRHADRLAMTRFMVETVEANIREFLREREHVVVGLETVAADFPRFWEWIGAEGDLGAALAEWGRVRNEGRGRLARRLLP